MAKFSAGMSLGKSGVAQGREAWSGELPPTGSYSGILKVLSTGVIGPTAQNAGKGKLSVGVELVDTPGGKYDGYVAWGNLNLIDSAAPFINQFLFSLTDGSDAQLRSIQQAFENNMETDNRNKHIVKIGRWYINSPEGALPIKVSISNKPFNNTVTGITTQQVRIESYLLGGGAGPTLNGSHSADVVAEEEPAALIDEDLDADESILD